MRGDEKDRRGAGRARRRVLPGFGLTLGITVTYLSLIVLIPLSALFAKAASLSWPKFVETLTDARVVAALKLTVGASAAAAAINCVFGAIVAWTLVRYEFPGRRIVDALVDLPFALPTAVSGIALTAVYAPNGWIGSLLAPLGIKVAFTPLGIVVALTFIGLPFVVRTLQPAILALESEFEEAAASLGAGRFTAVRRVVLPALLPALVTGFALAFARALGEYGSVVFISGNMPLKTEIASLLVITKLEQYDYAGASAIAVAMLVLAFLGLVAIHFAQRLAARGAGTGVR
ncbi:MAG: sulfate ABC transporter permease subunit CysT [Planctomycetota bacterium]|nr:sulfate ABC transporter permease subunit CysT [Planctomycetota bacterium]